MSDLVGYNEDRFSHDAAQISRAASCHPLSNFMFANCEGSVKHGMQHRIILVDIFFHIFEIIIFCCVLAICDLVHDMKTIFHLSYVLRASGNLF